MIVLRWLRFGLFLGGRGFLLVVLRMGGFLGLEGGVYGLGDFEHECLPFEFMASHSFVDLKAGIKSFRVAG